ncbi:hypothetical protein SUDANB95_07999 (plasmid) [Actinosynnema sp. ALI-1.44]
MDIEGNDVGGADDQGRSLEDLQHRVRQLLLDFPQDQFPEAYGVLGLIAGMVAQVRVRCEHCGGLTPSHEQETAPAPEGAVLDFADAARRRRGTP